MPFFSTRFESGVCFVATSARCNLCIWNDRFYPLAGDKKVGADRIVGAGGNPDNTAGHCSVCVSRCPWIIVKMNEIGIGMLSIGLQVMTRWWGARASCRCAGRKDGRRTFPPCQPWGYWLRRTVGGRVFSSLFLLSWNFGVRSHPLLIGFGKASIRLHVWCTGGGFVDLHHVSTY